MNRQQLKAILWLRWRLSQNQFIRAGTLGVVVTILVVVLLAAMLLAAGIGGLVGGVASGQTAKPEVLLLICDVGIAVFLFVWLIGIMAELQRSESIELSKLMHLPVSLRQAFLFNYAASHLTPTLLLFVPLLITFCLGLAFGAGLRMLLLAAVSISFILMVTSWTYCIRGWLSSLMANRRRAGAIAVWLTISLVVIAQIPNLVMQSSAFRSKRGHKPSFTAHLKGPALIRAHVFVPPGWVGYSAMTLKQGSYGPAVAATLLSLILAAAGILRGESLTRRYYSATGSAVSPRVKAPTSEPPCTRKGRASSLLVERRIPFLKDDTAGLALATLRSLARAPEMKMGLLMPVILVVVMGGPAILRMRAAPLSGFTPFVVSGGLMLIWFAIAPTMANVFGLDRGGFRALVLSPMPRRQMLLAKNLAFLPVVLLLSILVVGSSAALLHAGASVALTGLLQAVAGFSLFASACNYLAILAPYRYSMNSLKAKKFNAITLLSALASMIIAPTIFAIVMMPTFLQYVWTRLDWPGWVPINLLSALALVGLACWLYLIQLPYQGGLLQRRELRILQEVTTEME